MLYKDEIELAFNPALLQSSLSQTLDNGQHPTVTATKKGLSRGKAEKTFVIQHLQQYLVDSKTTSNSSSDLMSLASSAWNLANNFMEQIQALDKTGITHCDLDDGKYVVRTTILVPNAESKIYLSFTITRRASDDFAFDVTPRARVAYGEQYSEDKMSDFAVSNMSDEAGSWARVAQDLRLKLIARGRK